jgi:hypothetical protein
MSEIGVDLGHEGSAVFISYDHAQDEEARHVARMLSRQGIACRKAPDGIPAGDDYEDAVEELMDECDAVILLFTAEADRSERVALDAELADDLDIPVLLLRLEASEPDELREWLGSSEWIDWTEGRDDTLVRVAERVKRLFDQRPTAEELLQAAVNHPMNVASRRNGLIVGVLTTLLVIGGIAYGVWSGLSEDGSDASEISIE